MNKFETPEQWREVYDSRYEAYLAAYDPFECSCGRGDGCDCDGMEAKARADEDEGKREANA